MYQTKLRFDRWNNASRTRLSRVHLGLMKILDGLVCILGLGIWRANFEIRYEKNLASKLSALSKSRKYCKTCFGTGFIRVGSNRKILCTRC